MVASVPAVDAGALARAAHLPLDRHPAAVYLAGLAAGSRRTMRGALNEIAYLLTRDRLDAAALDWARLRYQHTAWIRAQLQEVYAPATVNKMLAALRGVLKQAWKLEQMTAEDYHRAIDLAPVKGSGLPRGRALPAGELRALFTSCAAARPTTGARDAALLAVLYGAGLRRAEAAALDLADYDRETGALTVHGKGRKQRVTYAPAGGRSAIAAWLALRGEAPGPLFWPIDKAGRMAPRRMSDQAILGILARRARAAGVPAFSPHDLRRSFISDLLDANADLAAAQRLAGHENPVTTARYDRRGEQAKRKAAELLHVPYVGREPPEAAPGAGKARRLASRS